MSIPDDIQIPADTVVRALAAELGAMCIRRDELAHWTHRMLQALDCYWMWCDGWAGPSNRWPRSESTAEDWWTRFEKYRQRVEDLLKEAP